MRGVGIPLHARPWGWRDIAYAAIPRDQVMLRVLWRAAEIGRDNRKAGRPSEADDDYWQAVRLVKDEERAQLGTAPNPDSFF